VYAAQIADNKRAQADVHARAGHLSQAASLYREYKDYFVRSNQPMGLPRAYAYLARSTTNRHVRCRSERSSPWVCVCVCSGAADA
jgi:hypothetical protein